MQLYTCQDPAKIRHRNIVQSFQAFGLLASIAMILGTVTL